MRRLTLLSLSVLVGACVGSVGTLPTGSGSGGTSATGAAGTNGAGTAGMTGAAGTGTSGTAGMTGAAGTAAAGTNGTTGVAGTTGAGGSATAGTNGTGRGGGGGMTGAAGRGGSSAGGRGGAAAGTTGTGGAVAGDCAGPACGPTAEQFFDNAKLASIYITFDAADTGTYTPAQWLDLLWSKWNHCPPFDASDLVKVTFQYTSPDGVGNVTMKNVGMRIRGSKARNVNQLQGFKLDFQKLLGTATGAARRRFADVNRLNTLSIEADPSHMIQCLSYKMERDFGIPGPYCNHLKVYVNGTYYGLMENIEEPEIGRFLAHHFGSTAGNVYEGSPSQGECSGAAKFNDGQAKLLYSGDTFSSYTTQYKITRGTTADAEANLIPMIKCGDSTATASDATFQTCIADWLDTTEWFKELAIESLAPQVESFMMERNFLLYFVPDSTAPHGGRFKFTSYDWDVAFNKASCYPTSCDPFTSTAAFNGPSGTRPKLATRLQNVFKSQYCQQMKDFLNNIYKPAAVDTMSAVIMPGMTNDPTTTMSAWQSAVSATRSYVVSHQTSALAQVTSACP